MFTLYIDNKPYQVKEGRNLLQACLSLGFDIPYFCWHPAMHSVGACRQCAVKLFKDEKDTRGRIVMSCMTPLAEGMRISIEDSEAKSFRKSITELLMLNHPHDCPVCDEGGECHLQDMTVMTGHNYRRSRFKKRTHRNQDLGPFINHEMNRCIQCYRCVRFYRGIAGGRDLNVFGSHDHVYFGRHEDGTLESSFSGNLAEICPTGVFTDKTLKRHYTRKWDLQTAPSICVHCSVGCNTIAGERYGTLRRIQNRYNHTVNGYFLCDRGRFGYEFVNSGKRVRQALRITPSPTPPIEGGATAFPFVAEDKKAALEHIKNILSQSKTIIGIGSPRASLESNFALRTLVGETNFYSGMSPKEHSLVSLIIEILKNSHAPAPSLRDIQQADAILILGEDVSNTAPMIAFAIRQASRNKQFDIAAGMKLPLWDDNAVRNAGQENRSPVHIVSTSATNLDDIAASTWHASPHNIALLGCAIAHELDDTAPAVDGLSQDIRDLASRIALSLKNAKHPVIVSGIGCLSDAVIKAAANIATALCAIGIPENLCYAVHECNTMGIGLMKAGDIGSLAGHDIDTLIVLENDLYRRAGKQVVDELLGGARNVITIDHLTNTTVGRSTVVLPAATFAESTGTFVNYEGRAQRFYQVFIPQGDIQAGWKWLEDIMKSVGKSAVDNRQSFDTVVNALVLSMPQFAPVKDIAPSANFMIQGQKVPRQPHRCSGRTAMSAHIELHEQKPPQDEDTPFAYSMEGYTGQPPAPLIPRYWAPGWNSVQSLNKFQQETGGELRGDDTGKRLFEASTAATAAYFPVPDSSEADSSIACRSYSIFGSEELSAESHAIQERMKHTT